MSGVGVDDLRGVLVGCEPLSLMFLSSMFVGVAIRVVRHVVDIRGSWRAVCVVLLSFISLW